MRQPPAPDRLRGLLWAMFAQGAVITAIFIPVHILIEGVLGPLGVVPYVDGRYETFAPALGNWLVKLYLFVLMASAFYVFGHRLLYMLIDVGAKGGKGLLSPLAYGLAAAGTVAAALVLINVP